MPGSKLQCGARLRALRKSAKLTQEEVGKRLGVSTVMVSKMEKDNIDPPPGRLRQLAELYGVHPSEILREDPGSLRLEGSGNLFQRALKALQEQGMEILKAGKKEVWLGNGSPPVAEGPAEPVGDFWEVYGVEEGDWIIRVNGDSLEPLAHSGQALVVEPCTEAMDGTLIVAEVAGAAVIKRLRRYEDGRIDLEPVNPQYPNIREEEIKILGRIRKKINFEEV